MHVAIQGYFREWFVQTSNYKQITDLVKIMEQEFWWTYFLTLTSQVVVFVRALRGHLNWLRIVADYFKTRNSWFYLYWVDIKVSASSLFVPNEPASDQKQRPCDHKNPANYSKYEFYDYQQIVSLWIRINTLSCCYGGFFL